MQVIVKKPTLCSNISDILQAQQLETPMRETSIMSREQKVQKIASHMAEILETLDLDLNDESIRDTPMRVAKMYVNELFNGMNTEAFPSITTFALKDPTEVTQNNIPFTSTCEHHLMPFFGVAHITYYSKDRVIGLSKLNRIVEFYAKRPQVQERLTKQVQRALQYVLATEHVSVTMEAQHFCIQARGVNQKGSSTITKEAGGKYREMAKL
eukprot:403347314